MPSEDHEYYRMRAAEERECARNASDPKSRAVHLDLAKRYEEAGGQLDNNEHVQASYDALHRSVELLSRTSKQLINPLICNRDEIG